MAQVLRLAGGVDRSPAQHGFAARLPESRSSVNSPATDQDLARVTRVNLFVVGGGEDIARLVTSLWPCFESPVHMRRAGEPLRLPRAEAPVGTMVIYDVDTLTHREQHELNEWLVAASGRVRILSSASSPLLPMVEAGTFNDALYYRLNVVTIDLAAAVA